MPQFSRFTAFWKMASGRNYTKQALYVNRYFQWVNKIHTKFFFDEKREKVLTIRTILRIVIRKKINETCRSLRTAGQRWEDKR